MRPACKRPLLGRRPGTLGNGAKRQPAVIALIFYFPKVDEAPAGDYRRPGQAGLRAGFCEGRNHLFLPVSLNIHFGTVVISHKALAMLSSTATDYPILDKKELRLLDSQRMVLKAEQSVCFVFVNIKDCQQFSY